jgi:hypothetical protein
MVALGWLNRTELNRTERCAQWYPLAAREDLLRGPAALRRTRIVALLRLENTILTAPVTGLRRLSKSGRRIGRVLSSSFPPPATAWSRPESEQCCQPTFLKLSHSAVQLLLASPHPTLPSHRHRRHRHGYAHITPPPTFTFHPLSAMHCLSWHPPVPGPAGKVRSSIETFEAQARPECREVTNSCRSCTSREYLLSLLLFGSSHLLR